MATYNGARFLGEQLDSIAAQSLLPAELHVGDDGSTDDTIGILEAFRGRAPFPVHIHINSVRLGGTENFFQTALRCSSEWIAFSDQDDVWLPAKLERCAQGIRSGGPDLRLVAHNAMIVDAELQPLHLKTYWRGTALKQRLTLPPHWMCAGFSQVCHARLLRDIPADARLAAMGADHRQSHDAWVALLAVATGSVLLLGEPLALYRRHETNQTPLWETAPRTAPRKAARALRDNSAAYVLDSGEAVDIATLLRDTAQVTEDPCIAGLLRDAADRVQTHTEQLLVRASAYRAGDLRTRVRTVLQLARSGAYQRSGICSFGPHGLIKDLVYALRPGRRGGPQSW